MNRLRMYFARGRTLLLTVLVIMIGPPLLLLFVGLVGLATETRVEIDLAWVIAALAAVLLAVTLFHLVSFWISPKRTVNIIYELKLTQPRMPLGQYTFALRVSYDCFEKGQSRVTQQAAIDMRFRSKDHPDLLAWCTQQVHGHLAEHRDNATQLYPDAQIIISPGPTLETLEAEHERP